MSSLFEGLDPSPGPPYDQEDFPPSGSKSFPLAEVYGYERSLVTEEARENYDRKHCPFMNTACEKYVQYGYGYCSVVYKTENDTKPEVYAVCDHRLDGAPIDAVIADFFGSGEGVEVVSELQFRNPSQSFDYVAFRESDASFIAIETQAIDIRGGGVGPAWQAFVDEKPCEWRSYFTAEAVAKDRRDSVDYGVNMANITKRFGFQVSEKGGLLKSVGSKLYAVVQDRCYRYLAARIRADWHEDKEAPWDICFMTFDYTGRVHSNGQLEVERCRTLRATYESYARALAESTSTMTRDRFVEAIRSKMKRQ